MKQDENNTIQWEDVYCMGNHEYDKITVLDSPKDVLTHLMKIEKPNDVNDVNLDYPTWYQIQFAIKLLMDAYGIHINQKIGLLMHDNSKGDYANEISLLDKDFWWLDMYKTKWNKDTHQLETIKNNE